MILTENNHNTRSGFSNPERVSSFSDTDRIMMGRALQLAACGAGFVSPNPMVGAVVVSDGRIIGEGFHRRYGGPHAEVNAIASVATSDRHLIAGSTVYVTLEPCSHYGKTPPCSQLLIESRIGRVVIASPDPFPLVRGRGIEMMKKAGIQVETGLLERQAIDLNCRFMTAHTQKRPWIELKFACSANSIVGCRDRYGNLGPAKISSPATRIIAHRERALCDAIMVGTDTVIADNPSLDLRHWPGQNPQITVFASDRLPDSFRSRKDVIILPRDITATDAMHLLYSRHSITSLLVEGGPTLQNSLIAEGLYDCIRVETSQDTIFDGPVAPDLAGLPVIMKSESIIDNRTIRIYTRSHRNCSGWQTDVKKA